MSGGLKRWGVPGLCVVILAGLMVRFIPVEVQGIHGITPEMILSSPAFAEVYPEFAEYVAGTVLIAHNALFDVNFVSMETSRLMSFGEWL